MIGQKAARTRDAAGSNDQQPLAATGPLELRPPTAASKRPLSSFITRPAIDRTATPDKDDANFLQPGTTVASFQWPKICRTLNQQCGPQLDRVADLLRAQAWRRPFARRRDGAFPARGGNDGCPVPGVASGATRVRPAVPANHSRGWKLLPSPNRGLARRRADGRLGGSARGTRRRLPMPSSVPRTTISTCWPSARRRPRIRKPLAAGLQAAVTAGVLRHAYDLVLVDLGTFFDPTSQPVVLELVRNMGIDAWPR